MAFLDKATLWGIKKEATYGSTETIAYPGDLVELIDPSMSGTIDEIERAIVRNSLVKAESLLGKETSSGSLAVEVSGSNVIGEVNGDVLYESAMGVRIPAVAPLTLALPSAGTTGVTVDAGTASHYQVGQGLKLTCVGGSDYVTITSIVGNLLNVAPEITKGSVSVVTGLLSYRIATPSTPTTSFNVEEYLTSGVDNIVYKYKGVVANSMALEFPLADIVKASFSVAGAGFSGTTTTAKTGECFDLSPHIAKNITFKYDGVIYDINELTINVENEVYDSETLTSAGINKKLVTSKSNLGGSFMVDYDGLALFDKYKAKDSGELLFITTAGSGKKFGGYAPKVSLKSVSKSVDSSIYKDNVELQILSSDACTPGIEDAFSIWFE